MRHKSTPALYLARHLGALRHPARAGEIILDSYEDGYREGESSTIASYRFRAQSRQYDALSVIEWLAHLNDLLKGWDRYDRSGPA